MSVKRCQQEVDSEEFRDWIAYWQYNTLDEDGWDQTATICTMMSAALGVKNVKHEDFIPIKKQPQTAAEQMVLLRMSAKAQNARLKNGYNRKSGRKRRGKNR